MANANDRAAWIQDVSNTLEDATDPDKVGAAFQKVEGEGLALGKSKPWERAVLWILDEWRKPRPAGESWEETQRHRAWVMVQGIIDLGHAKGTVTKPRKGSSEAPAPAEAPQVRAAAPAAPEAPAEPRIKLKVNALLGARIVEDEHGRKTFRMIVDDNVRGPVGIEFPESEALWLFASIKDMSREFEEWRDSAE